MVKCYELAEIFKKNGLTFFTGVPDSTLKSWIAFINQDKSLANMIAVNECAATAICSGYNLATGKIGVLYMQNSGLGKAVNPLTSLCDKEVYSMPLIIMIGWRGEPGKKDEPQHKKMGKITLQLLELLDIPYKFLSANADEAEKIINEIKDIAMIHSSPAALIVKEGVIDDYKVEENEDPVFDMDRESAIKIIMDNLEDRDIVVSTTGKTSRELFEIRVARQEATRDFYTVGSMGCSSAIATMISMEKPNRKVIILDGDGAALMELGNFSTIGYYKPKNLFHIILDNNSYESTGGQKTTSDGLNFELIANACGYNYTKTTKTREELESLIKEFKILKGPCLIVVKINKKSRKDLGRPTLSPLENKKIFIDFLEKE